MSLLLVISIELRVYFCRNKTILQSLLNILKSILIRNSAKEKDMIFHILEKNRQET